MFSCSYRLMPHSNQLSPQTPLTEGTETGHLKVMFWGTPSRTSYKVAELLEKRGELAAVVEAVDHRSPGNENFYEGLIGKVRTRLLRCSPYQKAKNAGLPAVIYHSSRIN